VAHNEGKFAPRCRQDDDAKAWGIGLPSHDQELFPSTNQKMASNSANFCAAWDVVDERAVSAPRRVLRLLASPNAGNISREDLPNFVALRLGPANRRA